VSRESRPVTPIHWPNSLNMFDSCPQRYYLKHVRRLKGRVFARPQMTRGNITHQVLAQAFKVFAGRRDFPANLRVEIDERVGQSDIGAASARSAEARLIEDFVDCAIETFDRRKSVHTVESVYSYAARDPNGGAAFIAKAKVDLVVRREDGEIEHIDWKTGKRGSGDDIQMVVSRVAVGSRLGDARIHSTMSYLATREVDSRILSRDDARQTWIRVREIATGIDHNRASGEWIPIQSGLCASCEYYQHGCRLHTKGRADTLRGSE
jgi:hypothetical protein